MILWYNNCTVRR